MYGTITSAIQTGAEIGGNQVPSIMKNMKKPDNIGTGTWNKLVEAEAQSLSKSLNTAAKVAKKAGYGAVVIDVGYGIYQNRTENGASITRTTTDAVVDTGFGVTGVLTSTWTGAQVGGPYGAAAGFVTGVGYMVVTEMVEFNGKSMKDNVKDGFYSWWTQDNSQWTIPNSSYSNKSYYRSPTALPQSR